MDAVEAIIYCLGYVHQVPEDGYFLSQRVFDKDMFPHWIAWGAKDPNDLFPSFCSETDKPFAKSLEPYTTSKGRNYD